MYAHRKVSERILTKTERKLSERRKSIWKEGLSILKQLKMH